MWLVLILTACAVSAWGQSPQGELTLEVPRQSVGIEGRVRPGTWTPMRLELRSHAADARAVDCRWLLEDADGDLVRYERRVTLNPQRTQAVWLYGVPPVAMNERQVWTVQVLDAQSQRLLADRRVGVSRMVSPRATMLGVVAQNDLGLRDYAEQFTQHEPIELIVGLELSRLPDRWFGLAGFGALVWASDGGDPEALTVSAEVRAALREWVRRGGHLVISLPTIGQTWTRSTLADMLPVRTEQIRRVDDFDPLLLGALNSAEQVQASALVFEDLGAGVAVLERDRQGRPYAVAGRYGFGRVTVVGVDLTAMARLGLPNGQDRIWNRVFHWTSPALSRSYVEGEKREGRIALAGDRRTVELDRFIEPMLAMRREAAPALLAAMLLFARYWAVAGPLSFVVLRRRGALRHSWVVFACIVVVFSAISWGGAWLLQPRRTHIEHFTVLDVDASTGEVHAHSWLSLYIPSFDRVPVRAGEQRPVAEHALASPGLFAGLDRATFLDQQTYTVEVPAPNHAELPARATAKQIEIEYVGRIDTAQPGLDEPWGLPRGDVRIGEDFWPHGLVAHNLPGTFRDPLFVYCPGNATAERTLATPLVWRLPGEWPAGQARQITPPSPTQTDRLVRRPSVYRSERQWRAEGYLGARSEGLGIGSDRDADPFAVTVGEDRRIDLIDLLSFYDAMPPPNFRRTDFRARNLQRSQGRALDMTHLIAGRRLIMVGHLEDSPLPIPLTVDGEPVPSRGWTVVRWIYDLQEPIAVSRTP